MSALRLGVQHLARSLLIYLLELFLLSFALVKSLLSLFNLLLTVEIGLLRSFVINLG